MGTGRKDSISSFTKAVLGEEARQPTSRHISMHLPGKQGEEHTHTKKNTTPGQRFSEVSALEGRSEIHKCNTKITKMFEWYRKDKGGTDCGLAIGTQRNNWI